MKNYGKLPAMCNNVTNFYYWCATRILTLDRQYAKEILNSIGVLQAATDRDRAQIALSCHCLSLADIYWVKEQGETVTFEEINLYENHLSNTFADVSLRGKQLTVENESFLRDLSTDGCFPKAWIRRDGGFVLMKDGGAKAVEDELLASKICQCFQCRQVIYEEGIFDGEKVSVSRIMTSLSYGIVSRSEFEIYAMNHELDPMEYILQLDGYSFHMMNILDYLVGNTDRHWGNWGFLVDNETNRFLYLHPLMDFNQAFQAYDTLEGTNCQTWRPRKLTQREAALAAVREIGINQVRQVEEAWFAGRRADYEMFRQRLECLRKEM